MRVKSLSISTLKNTFYNSLIISVLFRMKNIRVNLLTINYLEHIIIFTNTG